MLDIKKWQGGRIRGGKLGLKSMDKTINEHKYIIFILLVPRFRQHCPELVSLPSLRKTGPGCSLCKEILRVDLMPILLWVSSIEKKHQKKLTPQKVFFFVTYNHLWTGLRWLKPIFAFWGPIGAVGGQFWVLGVLKGRKFEISKLDHFWPWDAIFST